MEARLLKWNLPNLLKGFVKTSGTLLSKTPSINGEFLSHYQLGREMLEELAEAVLSEFTTNIDKKTTVETIADRYVQLGIRCCEDGLSYSEMVRVFILLKRHIWLFFQESNFAGQPFDVRSIVALNNRTALFFDRAMYHSCGIRTNTV